MFELIKENQLNIMLMLCGICAGQIVLLIFTRFLSKTRKAILMLMGVPSRYSPVAFPSRV